MNHRRRPNGRENIVASKALEELKTRESREAEMATLAAIIPGTAAWRNNKRGAIRLIDLERRARFSRLSFEAG
ncbi:hypothetical protein LG047_17365 [Methylocystis sp. WRRC1]|uniref:hypothetical protein n=1 Tax=Methylocystis sp. WRRC1 TaxID=1732014 RepID=UPI001D133F43|nr:hypothetical protein [Methylocystis sp. WRRC1]MCC3247066.1 hypothetical protein [Methylocystis sp. WRRC1]